MGGLLGVQCTAAAVRGDLSLSLSPTELMCDTESDHMTSVVAMFHTDCCSSSSSFAGFNPQVFTRPCNTSAYSVMQTLVASAGKTSFITGGVDAQRTVRKSSNSTCTNSVTNCVYTRLFLPFQNVSWSSEAPSSRNPRQTKITEADLTRPC